MRQTFPLAALAIVSLAGCDLFDSVSSTVIVSGLLVSTPAMSFPGYMDVQPETLATAWVGERDSATSTNEPKPLAGVPVTVTRLPSGTFQLKEVSGQPGVYQLNSVEDPNLTYQAAATYVFDGEIGGEKYGGQGDAPPRLEAGAVTFQPALSPNATFPQIKTHQKNVGLNVTWGQQYGRYAYVSVLRADKADPQHPKLVFDTRPKTAKEVLDFVVGDPPTSIDIPASTFDQDGLYALLLVAANKGGPRSNTFIGSPYLIGSAVAELFAIGTL